MSKKKTHEEFVQEVKDKYGDEYEVLGKYVNNHTKIKVLHTKCEYEWKITPHNLLTGKGCPICGGTKKKTHEEFVCEISEKYGDKYEILGEYINNRTKILVRHNKCGYGWEIKPNNLLSGQGCPVCRKKESNQKKTKTHEEFIKEIKDKYGDEYTVLGEYKGANIKIKVRHNCGCKWYITPANLLSRKGCPVCSSSEAKLGFNTIWDTDRWMCDLGVSEEDAKRYTSRSNKKITVKCPNCGKDKEIRINQIYNNKSTSCSCGDGKSYPEKFVMNLLEQLGLDFEIEYKPKWIDNKRYDLYIKDNNCIIETHGEQHYEEKTFSSYSGRTLEEEQLNDKYKKEIALQNGIKHYIELNCSESNMNYIKHSILNSELSELFDVSKINWKQCAEFANKNIVKEVCDYWNNRSKDETTTDLGKMFKLDRTTIRNYLKRGNKLGWCNYDSKEEMRKHGIKAGGYNKKKVEIFKNGKSLGIFPSCAELSRQSEKLFGVKLNGGNISSNCNNKVTQYKGFIFKYVEEDK
ncbi:TPA: hypothetical protein ACH354_002268 [Clostridium perfringens]